jgi:hypothetical protein
MKAGLFVCLFAEQILITESETNANNKPISYTAALLVVCTKVLCMPDAWLIVCICAPSLCWVVLATPSNLQLTCNLFSANSWAVLIIGLQTLSSSKLSKRSSSRSLRHLNTADCSNKAPHRFWLRPAPVVTFLLLIDFLCSALSFTSPSMSLRLFLFDSQPCSPLFLIL